MVNGMNFWTGVVENRNDPEKLGRCQVRIFGYHTDNKVLIPTRDLPWALPIQGVTSAAASGVGSTPIGMVTGSWVVGFFLDGDNCQQPVILGTIAGKPKTPEETEKKLKQIEESKTALTDISGKKVYDSSGKVFSKTQFSVDDLDRIQPLTKNDVLNLSATIAKTISNNDKSKIGENGELGKYQLTLDSLVDLGYIKKPISGKLTLEYAEDNNNWTGKAGIKSKEEFFESETLQDNVMYELIKFNYDTLIQLEKITGTEDKSVVAGLLSASHINGAINSDKLDKKTDSGTKIKEYFLLGVDTFGGDITEYDKLFSEEGNFLSDINVGTVFDELNNEELAKIRGFEDPNKKFPKVEYAGLTDLNKLAVGDDSHTSFKTKRNKRITKIPIARSSKVWEEPDSAYAAEYPYNQVIETEGGHVIEIDSTPNAERIHVFHKTGTYIEVDVNGSMVRKTVGENYEIIDRNNFVYVKGAHNLTVEGKTNILVKNDASLQVDGSVNVTSHKDAIVQAAGTLGINGKNIVISGKESVDIVSGGSVNIQGENLNLYSKDGSTTIKASKDISLQSGKSNKVSIKGGIELLLDAIIVKTKMGANTIKGISLATLDIPQSKNPSTEEIPELERKVYTENVFLLDSEEPESEQYGKSRSLAGFSNSNIVPETRSGTKNFGKTSIAATPVSLDAVEGFTTYPNSYRLSKYFTLGDFLKHGNVLVPQKGLTEAELVLNMKNLATNCLDAIKEKYPSMIISSGFRQDNRRKDSKGNFIIEADHGLGGAVDIVFRNIPSKDHVEIAEWIASNVPYRQLLLEYEIKNTRNSPTTWIHLALVLSDEGSVINARTPTATFKNHKVYAKNQFVQLA